MNRQHNFNLAAIISILATIATFGINQMVSAQPQNITNDTFWNTVDGQHINSQGGGIFTFTDPTDGVEKYFWYGAFYKEAELYRKDPSVTQPKDNFVAVTCYTSTDLVNWQFKSNALERDELNSHYDNTGWAGRLGVAFVKEMNKYAMFIQHDNGVLIALSDSPVGPFEWHQRLDMTETIGTPNTGDQTVFTDEDTGISYLVYTYGRGRNKIYISEIGVKNGKVDLLDCTQIYKGAGREGNCMVKYNGKYYVFASNLYGWDSSYAYYLVSDNIRGPYSPENEMLIAPGCMDDYSHVTQTGFFVKVKGSKQETVIFCGDRWANFAGNGLGYNQWCPLSFDGETPYFNSLHSWNLDESTGEWRVDKTNNYIKNGSFEADRRYIPSTVKPIQEQLKSWTARVYEGNVIVIGDAQSPVLNHFNSQEDRQSVVGEKSLNISDKIKFKRKVYQIVESSPYVTLEDGAYDLTLMLKNSSGFNTLEIYAESQDRRSSLMITEPNSTWKQVKIENINIVKGKVEIGFWVDGDADASCQIDDVTLVKKQ